MKKILFVTGSRADYGLLKDLILLFQNDDQFETYTVATGSHLSTLHGKTVEILKADNLKNLREVDLKIAGDKPQDICNAISVGVLEFAKIYEQIKPDLIVVLGDRYELWSACMPSAIFNIPVAHIHGGESTEGLIDESVRHSITKMSYFHFCSHPLYQKRIISMGEDPSRVHLVGAVGLDRIKKMSFLSKKELESGLNIKFSKQNILCTFHPVTLDEKESNYEMDQLILALEELVLSGATSLFITYSNADTYSGYIRKKWETFVAAHPQCVFGFTNLGDLRYLSLMDKVDLVLGNSSSGIIEAPFLNKMVIDIGNRQKGRLKSPHILSSNGKKSDLLEKIRYCFTSHFKSTLSSEQSLYGTGDSNKKIYSLIKSIDLQKLELKKFYDGENK